jgi:hypothetical protein
MMLERRQGGPIAEQCARADTEVPAPAADAAARPRRRAVTLSRACVARLVRKELVEQAPCPDDPQRPRTRGECIGGPRPCPFVGCRHHLYLEVNWAGGLKLNFPGLEVWEMADTCSLDVADRDGVTLEEVGDHMNLTRERIRQDARPCSGRGTGTR